MKKIFLQKNELKENTITINLEESNHIMNALRHKIGDKIIVSDEKEKEYVTEIKDFSQGQVILHIKDVRPLEIGEIDITLIQGLCKGEKMEFIIQKATELGVKKIIPLETMRTIVKLDKSKGEKRVERWQKIAAEAAKQCNAKLIPEVSEIVNVKQLVTIIDENTEYILFWEEEKETRLKEILKTLKTHKVALIIGPEGGFDKQEVEFLRGKAVVTASLGDRILRTETAALAALSCVMYHYGELG